METPATGEIARSKKEVGGMCCGRRSNGIRDKGLVWQIELDRSKILQVAKGDNQICSRMEHTAVDLLDESRNAPTVPNKGHQEP